MLLHKARKRRARQKIIPLELKTQDTNEKHTTTKLISATQLPTEHKKQMLLLSLKQLHATAILLALAFTGASNFVTAAAAADTVTTDQLDVRFPYSNPAPPGKNIDGTSVTTNFVRAYNEKQLFLLMPFALALFEKPASPALPASPFWWCSDFTFSNFTTDTNAPMGFVGRCVWTFKEGGSAVVAAGVQGYVDDPSERFSSTLGVSVRCMLIRPMSLNMKHIETLRIW